MDLARAGRANLDTPTDTSGADRYTVHVVADRAPVESGDPSRPDAIEVHLPGGVRLLVPPGCDRSLLRDVIACCGGTAVCGAGTTCIDGACCDNAQVCGTTCCGSGQECCGGTCVTAGPVTVELDVDSHGLRPRQLLREGADPHLEGHVA